MKLFLERRLNWFAALTLGLLLLTAREMKHPVAAASPAVRPGHPRIWLTPTVLAHLRAQAAANSPRWLALQHVDDTYLHYTDGSNASVANYALAYQISGNTVYADRAIQLMQALVQGGPTAITRDAGYDARSLLPAMALGYDWCYDRLTPTQRDQFRALMEQWADWVWPETNPSRATGWAVASPGNNYYHGFMMTWLVGLALSGDSPKAQGYIDLARQKWLAVVRPYLDTTGAGGYLLEGTNYGTESTFAIFWYLAAHASATGEDLLNAPGFLWPQQAILNQLYGTTPTRDRLYPGGDQARDSQAGLSDYDRSAALVAQSYLDPTTAGYGKWWLDHITPNRNQWRESQWQECLWYQDEVAARDYTQTLSPGYWAAGSGWMTSRSGWDSNATQVVMQTGPTLESHEDRAQNGFLIYRGDWLAASAKLNSQSGLIQAASANNALTIGGHEQIFGQTSAHVLHFADTGRYAYFAGEASGAYNKPDLKLLNSFRRELLFLKPSRILVFDRVNALDGKLVKKWHLNTLKEPAAGADSYQTTAGGSTLFGKSLLPTGATIAKQAVHEGRNGALSSWRLDIAAPVGNKVDHFLNVLEAAPDSQTGASPVVPIRTGRSSLMGAQIGNQAVIFDVSPGQTITYQTNPLPALEHFILDQAPGKWYQVAAQSAKGDLLQQQRVQASDQGVLTFPITRVPTAGGWGGRTITISPAAPTCGGYPPASITTARHHAGGRALKPRKQSRAGRAGG